ncbi:MAG: ComEC/Rec2 family competence protein [Proteobacteria bacterium]|nr:ComEC/Rec2 family competence protein [Pseudomonadota bacterium]
MTAKAPLWYQRLPFAGLAGAAAAGILGAWLSPLGSGIFLILAVLALAAWLPLRRSICVYGAVALLFAALQVLQTRESSAASLVEGIVRTEPSVGATGKSRFVVQAKQIEIDGEKINLPCDILAVVPSSTPALEDSVRLIGSLRPIAPPRNPGQFNAKRVMELRGITCELVATSPMDLEITSQATGFSLPRIAASCRKWMESTLREGISSDPLVCNLLTGIVLGVTSDIPDTLQDEFRQTGTFHLFSVSGLHVGMIALILWQAFRMAGMGRGVATCVIIPALFFYALLTGWKPSSVRAATMTAIFLIGMASGRQSIALNSLCAAAFVILLQSTNELFNPGFQLSFTVVAAILLVASPLQERIRMRLEPDPFIPVSLWTKWQKKRHEAAGQTAGLLAVSLAAWIGSLPLTVFYFHMVSLSALAANLLVVPLSFFIMATAVLSLVSGLASSALAAVFNNANLVFTKILLLIIQAAASLPGSFLPVGNWQGVPAALTIFDCGAGGATAIQSSGGLWLIDCGSRWDFENIVTPWMRSTGHWRPDALVLTHGDANHIGGVGTLLDTNSLPRIIDSSLKDRSPVRRRLHAAVAAANLPISKAQAGDRFEISPSMTLQILYPPSDLVAATADDKSLVALVDSSPTRVLILSDAGPTTFEWLLQNQRSAIAANIVILGRHHSGAPPEASFLRAVNPSLVIAAAAGFPSNEPIDEEWASMVEGLGIRLFRQDRTGAAMIRLDKQGYAAKGFLNGETFKR